MGRHSVLRHTRSIILVFALAACSSPKTNCPVRESDQAIVNHALDVYGKGKISRKDILQSNDIAVVYLPDMTCIGFNVRAGTAGGDETMCFDRNGRKVLGYRNGD